MTSQFEGVREYDLWVSNDTHTEGHKQARACSSHTISEYSVPI